MTAAPRSALKFGRPTPLGAELSATAGVAGCVCCLEVVHWVGPPRETSTMWSACHGSVGLGRLPQMAQSHKPTIVHATTATATLKRLTPRRGPTRAGHYPGGRDKRCACNTRWSSVSSTRTWPRRRGCCRSTRRRHAVRSGMHSRPPASRATGSIPGARSYLVLPALLTVPREHATRSSGLATSMHGDDVEGLAEGPQRAV